VEKKFEVEFLPDAVALMDTLDGKSQEKIYYNIRKAQVINDSDLFKKLTTNIWEFRTIYNQTYYRLFAFWGKRGGQRTIVVATHGLVKKTAKTPTSDLEKAERLRKQYFGLK
jgi:phage-related protein